MESLHRSSGWADGSRAPGAEGWGAGGTGDARSIGGAGRVVFGAVPVTGCWVSLARESSWRSWRFARRRRYAVPNSDFNRVVDGTDGRSDPSAEERRVGGTGEARGAGGERRNLCRALFNCRRRGISRRWRKRFIVSTLGGLCPEPFQLQSAGYRQLGSHRLLKGVKISQAQ
jgi:hypothetical protein